MTSWDKFATLSTLITLQDLAKDSVVETDNIYQSPVLKRIAEAQASGYDTICLPLTTEKWKHRWTDMCLLPVGSERDRDIAAEERAEAWRSKPAFLADEVTMSRLDEAENVTILVSDWLELDAADDWVRHDAEIALHQELSYATYLNIHHAILPPPRNRACIASYARTINYCLTHTPFINLSVRLPIYDPSIFHAKTSSASSSSRFSLSSKIVSPVSTPLLVVPDGFPAKSSKSSPFNSDELNVTWEMWDVIRSICEYSPRLTLTLDLAPPLPTALGILKKWSAESVRFIFLPSSTFIANTRGYPVLPKPTQAFVRGSMAHRPTVILTGANSGLHGRGGETAYAQYVRHLEKTSHVAQSSQKPGTVENYAQGYQDYLQAPLQPLMDNLQSITYDTFEQDPVKYKNYEEAMYQALMEWPKMERIVFCIAGAGRGPIVARCLAAIERSRREAFVYAVEKNPNAFVTLQSRQENEWGARVKLFFGDMRFIELPEKVDIIVSELLGSLGDNELSPECLDGAMRFLKPDGISIPSSYTAHLAPLSSSKLYHEARINREEKNLETPYVVMFQAVNILSGDGGGLSKRCGPQIQECWEFEHPRKDAVLNEQGLPPTNSHNTRSAKLTFHIPHAGVLHGLAGYFEAILYGNIGLSIHPHRKDQISKDMLSWFPLFFPFKDPLYLPSNSELHVSIWRLTNRRQVWYEWYAESFFWVQHPPLPVDPSTPLSSAVGSPRPYASIPSPLVDAVDSFAFPEKKEKLYTPEVAAPEGIGMVKIGQTSLHNPSGRSSWIGL